MTSRGNKGNPRDKQAAISVNAEVAKQRAAKTGAAKSGNPRVKNYVEPAEIEGFKRESVSQIKTKPERRKREESESSLI